jgi:hypothetical protein
MNCFFLLFAIAFLDLAYAQVDPGAGTYFCHPCARQEW